MGLAGAAVLPRARADAVDWRRTRVGAVAKGVVTDTVLFQYFRHDAILAVSGQPEPSSSRLERTVLRVGAKFDFYLRTKDRYIFMDTQYSKHFQEVQLNQIWSDLVVKVYSDLDTTVNHVIKNREP